MLNRVRTSLSPLAFVFVLWVVSAAAAQSAPDASERERALQQDLDAALQRIEELSKQVEDLQAQLPVAGAPSGNSPPTAASGSVAGTPWKCSDDAVAEARRRYAATFDQKPIPSDAKSADFGRAMRGLKAWATVQSVQMRMPIEWVVRCLSLGGEDQPPGLAELIVVDPASGKDVGFPFPVMLPLQGQRRINEAPEALFELHGMLQPTFLVVTERPEAGPFQERPFIGPYCELTFQITPQTFFRLPQRKPPVPAPSS